MSHTPPEPPVPPGYQPGDYIPFKDRDPDNPTAVAGQPTWGEQLAQQAHAAGPVDPYRALYGYDAAARVNYASWGKRVLAYLFDSFLGAVTAVPLYIGYVQTFRSIETTTGPDGRQTISSFDPSDTALMLMAIGGFLSFAFWLYNIVIRQGRTGYTFGKSVVGIQLVRDRDGQTVGAGMSFVRQLAHIVDGMICNLGYLWPLWDSKNQTIGDKIVGTVVVVRPHAPPQRG